jgi:hypothetical protein
MKTIETISVWTKGQIKTADFFRLKTTYDDLESTADFFYELLDENLLTEPYIPYVIAEGNLRISGAAYTAWKADTDTNEYAYTWAADQLNLVITTTP